MELETAVRYVIDNGAAIRNHALTNDVDANIIVKAYTLYYRQREAGAAGMLIAAVERYQERHTEAQARAAEGGES